MALGRQLRASYLRAKVLNEFSIMRGDYRIDLAVIHKHEFHGYEIKSDADTLRRLPDQAKYFSWVFHRMTLVTGPVHLAAATALIPTWWGITVVDRDAQGVVTLTPTREPQPNPKLNYRWVARLLWRDEIALVLKRLGKYRGASKLAHAKLAEHLRAVVDEPTLVTLVSQTILSRTEWLRERGA